MNTFIYRSTVFLCVLLGATFIVRELPAASVESRVKKLEQQLKVMQATASHNNQRLAEALATFEQVREEMAAFRGTIGKIAHHSTSDMSQRQKDLTELDYRLTRMEERFATVSSTLREVAAVKTNKKDKTAAQELLYQQAFSELTHRNYQAAVRTFKRFVQKYPKSNLADNAQYWVGECYFAMGDFQKAILEFQTVLKKYPNGNKTPAALLKQGFSFVELKSYADAKAFLEKVIRTYPKTPEALQAKEKLVHVDKLIQQASKGTP